MLNPVEHHSMAALGTRPTLRAEIAPSPWSRSVTPIPRACVVTTTAAAWAIVTLKRIESQVFTLTTIVAQ